MFAGFVPEIMEIIGRRERYGGTYDKPAGVKYVYYKPQVDKNNACKLTTYGMT